MTPSCGGTVTQQKMKHMQVLVAIIQWINLAIPQNTYSEIYQTGCDSAIIKLFSDQEPSIKGANKRAVALKNGEAIKCFRDGIPTANTVSIFNADRVRGENNFFSR